MKGWREGCGEGDDRVCNGEIERKLQAETDGERQRWKHINPGTPRRSPAVVRPVSCLSFGLSGIVGCILHVFVAIG